MDRSDTVYLLSLKYGVFLAGSHADKPKLQNADIVFVLPPAPIQQQAESPMTSVSHA